MTVQRREPTDAQVEAAALCVHEAYRGLYFPTLVDARNAVLETHAALADDYREPYWAWSRAS